MSTIKDFDTHVDEALLTISELDWVPVCQNGSGCAFGYPPATYIVRIDCKCDPLQCTPCSEELSKHISRGIRLGFIEGDCQTCGAVVSLATLRIEPLP